MIRRTSHEVFKSSPEVKNQTNKQTKQNDANRPMTERLLVFSGRLSGVLSSFAIVGTIHKGQYSTIPFITRSMFLA